jgi:hypothetical protein
MTPLFADGIDFPLVLVAGFIVLVPLMAFEVFVEAFILNKIWHLSYSELCAFAFFANLWSLLAGIPTKVLNAFLYAHLLPQDIPGFFARYPLAIALGSLIYFVVTLLVEGAYAFRWRRRKEIQISGAAIWRGVLLANVASYVVLSPLYYFATKPGNQIHKFSHDTHWTSNPRERVIFVDAATRMLEVVNLDGSTRTTVVPFSTADYLVSSNLDLCLFRGTNGNLYFYQSGMVEPRLVWQTKERFLMRQVAFSPSGNYVAFASENQNSVDLVERATTNRIHLPLAPKFGFDNSLVAWSTEESTFYVGGFENKLRLVMRVQADHTVLSESLEGTNAPPTLICYGRVGTGGWWGGNDWGVYYSDDRCGDLEAMAWPGLDSGLMINRGSANHSSRILGVSVRPGLLHLAGFYFGDVGFVGDCRECLFESNGFIYLLDIPDKRLGTLVKGARFIRLTSRYEKRL